MLRRFNWDCLSKESTPGGKKYANQKQDKNVSLVEN